MNCSDYSNKRAPARCVAVDQIMRYHEHPNSFSWSSMPDNTGSALISSLLYNIGFEVDMDYACSGSGANTGDAVNALTGAYNYSSASYTNYSHHTVKNEINAGYPVILRGRNSNSGHAWVCDGYRSSQYYECQKDPYGGSGLVAVPTHTTLYLHMIWGWGNISVGYYAFNGWDPTGTPGPYNDDKKMIVNIRP